MSTDLHPKRVHIQDIRGIKRENRNKRKQKKKSSSLVAGCIEKKKKKPIEHQTPRHSLIYIYIFFFLTCVRGWIDRSNTNAAEQTYMSALTRKSSSLSKGRVLKR